MAVSYTSNIYTQERLFFIKLLFRWSGSVWQLLWVDFIVFVAIYMILAAIYQNILFDHPEMKQTFEVTVKWIGQIRTSVPLSFMLGFFVSTVISRWWSTCMAIPWLYAPSFYSQAIVDTSKAAKSDIARKIRITVLRYLNLSWILLMGEISAHIKERFGFWRPKKREYELTWQKRIDLINGDTKVQKYFGALVTDEERLAFNRSAELSNDTDLSYSPEYWLPLVWATRLLRRARNIGLIADERAYLFMVEMIANFRSGLGTVWTYSEFNIPLVYTQVAVAAVYIFLMASLVSTQLTESDFTNPRGFLYSGSGVSRNASEIPDAVQILVYIPIIGSLEFIFYLGWFKIGVCLLNSLGKDKADLPLTDILNSNLKASVKLGGAEDTIFPNGLTDNGEPEEQQVAEFLHSFDFNGVHAHDKFGSAEETERQLRRALLKRLQGKSDKGHAKLPSLPDGSGKSTGSKDSGLQSRMDYLDLNATAKLNSKSGKHQQKEQQKKLKAQMKQFDKALKSNGAVALANGKARTPVVTAAVEPAPPPCSPTADGSPAGTGRVARPSETIRSAAEMLQDLTAPEDIRLWIEEEEPATAGETSQL
ncbi:hypothetical protein BOX15_Mlig000526g1 [Macrostomum lignano]|uniref:Bestrophin homolog n=1 Tax=Macrostomum lignano TaxID=282301 RepID=A0A267H7I3_9PLAT|nr:hypothetical protein BOX15_Mlig000526g1 [Macrostomum lignano]